MSFDPVQFHFDLADHLKADAWFDDLQIETELPRTVEAGAVLENGIDKVFAAVEGNGAAVLVLLPELTSTRPNIPGPYFDQVELYGLALTSELLNASAGGAKLRCFQMARRMAQNWHHFTPNGAGTLHVSVIAPERFGGLTKEQLDAIRAQGLSAVGVQVKTGVGFDTVTKTLRPTITQGETTITLTPGADSGTVWYTTDGTFPWDGNTAAATQYSAPFAKPAAGTLIRAAAYKTDCLGSDVAELTIT